MPPIMNINSSHCFNDKTDMPPHYEAPPDKRSPTGKVVVLDRSASMLHYEAEFKLTLSMLFRGLAGLGHVPVVPVPYGGTNLIGKVKSVVEDPLFGEQELIVVTDGLDNAHHVKEFQVGVLDDGSPQVVTVDRASYTSDAEYMEDRQSAILAHLSYIGAKVHLIGIGSEVKGLLAMAGRHRMRAAHVPRHATASEVVAVVTAALDADTAPPLRCADFANAEEFEAEAERRVITIDRLGCRPAPDDEQVQAVHWAASMVNVDGAGFTPTSFKAAFEAAEAADIAEYARRYTRGVVLWLMHRSIEKGPIPGAAIGGARGKIFAEPGGGNAQWRVNQLLGRLKAAGILVSKKEAAVTMQVEGLSLNFRSVQCYAPSPRAAHLVAAMANDSEWATPASELVGATAKRPRDAHA